MQAERDAQTDKYVKEHERRNINPCNAVLHYVKPGPKATQQRNSDE